MAFEYFRTTETDPVFLQSDFDVSQFHLSGSVSVVISGSFSYEQIQCEWIGSERVEIIP